MPRAAQPSRTRRVYWLGLLLNLAAPGSGLTFVGQPVWHAVHVTAVVAVAAFAVLAVSVGAAPVWPAVLVVLGALAASTVHYHLAWRARTTRTGTPTDDGWRWALIATHALAGLALIVGGTVTSLVPRLTNERDRAQQALR
ncbi:hypothetical protein, partial [Deinococcus pimensis]|uniref:hypothetical protein n=1 Tax=Deinococcus pimensis TaxID=309888 RepID=UPI0005EBE2F6